MALFAQHGYGKSDKIERGVDAGHLGGVILSPRDEKPESMVAYVNQLRTQYPDFQVLLDPQFYVSTLIPSKEGNLSLYEYFQPNLTRRNFINPTDIASHVRSVIDYQVNLSISKIISPTVLFESFNDPWSQIALTLANASTSYYAGLENVPPILISICFSESALGNFDALNEFLDMISLLNVQGFYIIIKRDGNGGPSIDTTVLQNLMYLCYSLSAINQYEVIMGYTDFVGIPLYATGITAFSCGWFNSLREFSVGHFQPSTGGRRPSPRYSSEQLINSILIIPELDSINQRGLINNVISNTNYDNMIRTNPTNAPWPPDISCLHHWEILNRFITDIDECQDLTSKLDYVQRAITNAQQVYRRLTSSRIIFEPKSSSIHLSQWASAINDFRIRVGV